MAPTKAPGNPSCRSSALAHLQDRQVQDRRGQDHLRYQQHHQGQLPREPHQHQGPNLKEKERFICGQCLNKENRSCFKEPGLSQELWVPFPDTAEARCVISG